MSRPGPALLLPAVVRRAIVADARRRAPRECCGFLLGRQGRIEWAVAMRNVAPGRRRYRIDAREYLALRRLLRTVTPAIAIVGVYHSHPAGPPHPSATDIAEAFYPEWAYVIVSLGARPRVRAFRIRGGRTRELRLRQPRTGRRRAGRAI